MLGKADFHSHTQICMVMLLPVPAFPAHCSWSFYDWNVIIWDRLLYYICSQKLCTFFVFSKINLMFPFLLDRDQENEQSVFSDEGRSFPSPRNKNNWCLHRPCLNLSVGKGISDRSKPPWRLSQLTSQFELAWKPLPLRFVLFQRGRPVTPQACPTEARHRGTALSRLLGCYGYVCNAIVKAVKLIKWKPLFMFHPW